MCVCMCIHGMHVFVCVCVCDTVHECLSVCILFSVVQCSCSHIHSIGSGTIQVAKSVNLKTMLLHTYLIVLVSLSINIVAT